jgi:transcriptional regulator with XRE-family HTH domain
MTSFKEFLEEQLQDDEFAEAFEQASGEMDFALALAQRREDLGFTQQKLAQITGIKQPMIARIEGGQMPTAPTLQKLAAGLQVGIIITGAGILVSPFAGKAKPKTESSDHRSYQKAAVLDFSYKANESVRYELAPEKEYVA